MRDLNNLEKKKLLNEKLKYIGVIDGSKKLIVYQCFEHGVVHQRYDVHIKNLKCSKCPRLSRRKFNFNYIKSLIEKKEYNYEYYLEENKIYKITDKIDIKCNLHGIFSQKIHNHFSLNQNCPKCAIRKQNKLNTDIIKELEKKNLKIINYNGCRNKAKFFCERHGYYDSFIYLILKSKTGCPKCTKDNFLIFQKEKFINESKLVWNNILNIDYTTLDYNGSKRKFKVNSDIGVISQIPQNHINGFIPSSSTGETILELFLKKNNISYEKQKTFNGCINKRRLRFDFFLTEKNICIEYNGAQHYHPVKNFGGQERYEQQIKNDKIKEKYCSDNNITLIIISYKDSILQKLNNLL